MSLYVLAGNHRTAKAGIAQALADARERMSDDRIERSEELTARKTGRDAVGKAGGSSSRIAAGFNFDEAGRKRAGHGKEGRYANGSSPDRWKMWERNACHCCTCMQY